MLDFDQVLTSVISKPIEGRQSTPVRPYPETNSKGFPLEVQVFDYKNSKVFTFEVRINERDSDNDRLSKIANTCSKELEKRGVRVGSSSIIEMIRVFNKRHSETMDWQLNFQSIRMPVERGSLVRVVLPRYEEWPQSLYETPMGPSPKVTKPMAKETEWSRRLTIAAKTVTSPHPKLQEHVDKLKNVQVYKLAASKSDFVQFMVDSGKFMGVIHPELVNQLWKVVVMASPKPKPKLNPKPQLIHRDIGLGPVRVPKLCKPVRRYVLPLAFTRLTDKPIVLPVSKRDKTLSILRATRPVRPHPTNQTLQTRPVSVATQRNSIDSSANEMRLRRDANIVMNGHSRRQTSHNLDPKDNDIKIITEYMNRSAQIPASRPTCPTANTSSHNLNPNLIPKPQASTSRGFHYTFWVLYEDSDEKEKISVYDLNHKGAKFYAIIEVIKQVFAGRSPPKERFFEVFNENTNRFERINDFDMTLIPNLSVIRVLTAHNIHNNDFDGQRRESQISTASELIRSDDYRINSLLVRTLKEMSHRLNRSPDIWHEIRQQINHHLSPNQTITGIECQTRFCRLFCKYSSALKTAKTRTEAINSFEFFNTFSELDLKSLLSKTDNNLINLIRDFIQN